MKSSGPLGTLLGEFREGEKRLGCGKSRFSYFGGSFVLSRLSPSADTHWRSRLEPAVLRAKTFFQFAATQLTLQASVSSKSNLILIEILI